MKYGDDDEGSSLAKKDAARYGGSTGKPGRNQDGTRTRQNPRSGGGGRNYDHPVMAAAERFVERADEERLQLAKATWVVYLDMLKRVNASDIRKLRNPKTGEPLAWKSGKPMWPDILRFMVDVYFDHDYRRGDAWAWQDFCGVETFHRLLEYALFVVVDHASRRDNQETTFDRDLQRRTYLAELADRAKREPVREEPEAPPAPRRGRTWRTKEEREQVREERQQILADREAEVFGDDLEEWQELREQQRARRRQALARKRKARERKQRKNAAAEGDE